MRIQAFLFVTLGAACVACSSSSSSSSDSDSGANDTGHEGGGIVDPQNCVPPGSKGNDLGMGGYCSPGGGECNYAGPDGGARICTADVPDTPTHAWFCTYPCNTDVECGSDNYCATDPKTKSKGCVPIVCKALAGDAGTDDSSSDASSD